MCISSCLFVNQLWPCVHMRCMSQSHLIAPWAALLRLLSMRATVTLPGPTSLTRLAVPMGLCALHKLVMAARHPGLRCYYRPSCAPAPRRPVHRRPRRPAHSALDFRFGKNTMNPEPQSLLTCSRQPSCAVLTYTLNLRLSCDVANQSQVQTRPAAVHDCALLA